MSEPGSGLQWSVLGDVPQPSGVALTADGSQILLMEFEPNSTTNYTGNNGFSCECTPGLPPPPGRSLPDAARW